MSYHVAGEADTATATRKKTGGDAYSRSVDISGDRLAGYVSATSRIGGAARMGYKPHDTRWHVARTSSAPARRDAIRRLLARAESEAMRMEGLAEGADLIELSNAGFALRESLADLWQLRSERESDWGDLLNFLQGALAQEQFERFRLNQCQAIRSVIVDHLGSGVTDADDIERSLKLLCEAELDPWKAISGMDQFPNEEEIELDD